MSRSLVVSGFSCISSARINFSRLTLIIGPQASGKSVICKLAYFFNQLLTEQFHKIEDNSSLEDFKNHTAQKFMQLFPVSAWGGKKFDIEYCAGDYSVRLQRTSAKSERVKVSFSSFFEILYSEAQEAYRKLRQKSQKNEFSARIDADWSVRGKLIKEIRKKLGRDFAEYQLFIPAGRSFFTNAGKAIMLLDQGNLVDPIVGRFGRIFANFREHYQFGYIERSVRNPEKWREILGGELKTERDLEYVETSDGRRVPFVALSSGQQELLPLFMVLSAWGFSGKDDVVQHLYIEEPEAHLFPSAQSSLVEIFAELLNESEGLLDLVLTTHSPYVLSKFNNLVKAGSVGSEPAKARSVSKLIKRAAWIAEGDLSAYAISEGSAVSVVDDEGLIDGMYLDSISDEISNEFGKLLAFEHSHRGGNE